MVRTLIRSAIRLVVLAGILWVARGLLKRWVEGPPAEPRRGSWPPVRSAASVASEPGGTDAPPTDAAGPAVDQGEEEEAALPSWIAPEADGGVPDSHPVKAKASSRIYHLPGMAFYDRTTPDRLYASPEAAEADGFSKSKR